MRAALMLTTGNRGSDQHGGQRSAGPGHQDAEEPPAALQSGAGADRQGPDSTRRGCNWKKPSSCGPILWPRAKCWRRIYLVKATPPKALKTADDIIALDHNNLQAHLMRSSALLGMGDKDKAREELDYITKAYPQNPEARYQVGYLAYQDKDYKKAEQIFADLYKSQSARSPRPGRADRSAGQRASHERRHRRGAEGRRQ